MFVRFIVELPTFRFITTTTTTTTTTTVSENNKQYLLHFGAAVVIINCVWFIVLPAIFQCTELYFWSVGEKFTSDSRSLKT